MSTKVNLVPDENGNDPFVQLSGSILTDGEVLPSTSRIGAALMAWDSSNNRMRLVRTASGDGIGAVNVPEFVTGAITSDGTVERWRNNTQGTLLASVARTGTTASPIQTNYNARGILLTLNVTAAPNTAETLTIYVLFPDPVTNSTNFGVLASITTPAGSSLQSGGMYRLLVYPGISGTTSQGSSQFAIANFAIPRSWIGQVSHSGASSWTYSLGNSLIL